MKYLTGKDYDHLCSRCQAAIDACLPIVIEGPDTDDIEAPFMFAADHGMLCGGSTCKGDFEAGQIALWDGYYYEQIVVLERFHRQGGFWIARDETGQEVYPDKEDLMPITEQSQLVYRHAAHKLQFVMDLAA